MLVKLFLLDLKCSYDQSEFIPTESGGNESQPGFFRTFSDNAVFPSRDGGAAA